MDPQAIGEEVDWGDPAEITESIRRGLADVAAGRVISAAEFRARCVRLCAEFGVDFDNLPPEKLDDQPAV